MVKVKKSNGEMQEFMGEKIRKSAERAGATAEEAGRVVKEVSGKVVDKTVVTSKEIRDMVKESLRNVNEKASEAFSSFRK